MGFEWLTLADVTDVTGSGDQGGYQASVSVYGPPSTPVQDTIQDTVPNYRQMTLYNRNFCGQAWEFADRVAVDGLFVPQSISVDRGFSVVNGSVYTYHRPLSDIPVTGCYFIDTGGTIHAHDITNLRLADVVQHLLDTHVTITGGFDTTQIDPDTESSLINPYIVRENGSLWAALQKIAQDEFFVIYWDRNNRVIYRQHPQFMAAPPVSVATLDSNNLLSTYTVEYRTGRKIQYVTLLGLANNMQTYVETFPGGSGGGAPGTPIDCFGYKRQVRCNTSQRLYDLAERQFYWLNRDYSAVVRLANAWPFELFDLVYVTLAGTTYNGFPFSWTRKWFFVQDVAYRKENQFGWITELRLEECMY